MGKKNMYSNLYLTSAKNLPKIENLTKPLKEKLYNFSSKHGVKI